jgi:hypothetical protein
MNLRQNQITIGELLNHPIAKEVLEKELPQFAKKPYIQMASKMTLQQVLMMNKGHVPLNHVNRIIKELEAI